jgi:hypothetical protein
MTIEVFYFVGCPNHETLLERLPRLLELCAVDARIELRKVTDTAQAHRVRFLGSPTVRVDGRDVEPGAAQRRDYGLKCRIYQTPAGLVGLPPDEWILDALTTTSR